jgi:hypothetical protein
MMMSRWIADDFATLSLEGERFLIEAAQVRDAGCEPSTPGVS